MAIPGAYAAASTRTRGAFALSSQIPPIEVYGLENDLRLFCVAFRPENKIHLFPPSKRTAQILRDTVKEHWNIEEEHAAASCYTLCLEGTPFLIYARRENALLIKYICCLILERLKAQGWELVVCTDLSSKTDVTTWYFARVQTDNAGVGVARSQLNTSSLVCVSLSSNRKLQLINASARLQKVLHELVLANYGPGVDQDAHYGRDYQIKLKGTPWDTETRDEIVAACKLIIAIFRQFRANGYHLYGLVNLKDTADSFFFEYDPSRTLDDDEYMIMALDEHSILRLVNASSRVVDAVKSTIDLLWTPGLEAEGRIGVEKSHSAKASSQKVEETVCWEFVLHGSPWRAPTARIGQSRQFVTRLLDALLEHGWTVVTGLDITRSHNKKSALLFQRCPPVQGLHHACLSPLGKEQYQLINAPASLRQLIREEFSDTLLQEMLTENDSVYEIRFSDRWWVLDPEHEKDSYIYVRKRMGRLLHSLMDADWRVIASADVAQEIMESEDVNKGEGIHSWFVIYCGGVPDDFNSSTPDIIPTPPHGVNAECPRCPCKNVLRFIHYLEAGYGVAIKSRGPLELSPSRRLKDVSQLATFADGSHLAGYSLEAFGKTRRIQNEAHPPSKIYLLQHIESRENPE